MLRPSLLPKLEECACFTPSTGQSEAAIRGTLLDTGFRSFMQKKDLVGDFKPEDIEAILWASETLKALAGGDEILTSEDNCKVEIPSFKMQGTADAIVPSKQMLADLKSGQVRDYKAQMAAYALGLMQEHWANTWMCHLLFCDQKEIVTLQFTFEEASQYIKNIVDAYLDKNKIATPCDYCEWCELSTTCSARVSAAIEPLGVAAAPEERTTQIFELILKDPEKLGDFLTKCKILEKFQVKAEDAARNFLESGQVIEGWKLGKSRESEYVEARKVYEYKEKLGLGDIFESYGSMSGTKFRKLWAERFGENAIPEGIINKKSSKQPLTKN